MRCPWLWCYQSIRQGHTEQQIKAIVLRQRNTSLPLMVCRLKCTVCTNDLTSMEDILAYLLLSRGLCNCSTKGDVETGEWGEWTRGRAVIRAQQEGSGIESNLGHGIASPLSLPPHHKRSHLQALLTSCSPWQGALMTPTFTRPNVTIVRVTLASRRMV